MRNHRLHKPDQTIAWKNKELAHCTQCFRILKINIRMILANYERKILC